MLNEIRLLLSDLNMRRKTTKQVAQELLELFEGAK